MKNGVYFAKKYHSLNFQLGKGTAQPKMSPKPLRVLKDFLKKNNLFNIMSPQA